MKISIILFLFYIYYLFQDIQYISIFLPTPQKAKNMVQ